MEQYNNISDKSAIPSNSGAGVIQTVSHLSVQWRSVQPETLQVVHQ